MNMAEETAVDLAAGGLSGVIVSAVGYPVETVLVLMQSRKLAANTTYRDCVTRLYRREGVGGFFKGIPPRLLASGLDSALTFGGYRTALRLIGADEDRLRLSDVCVGGLGAGVATSTVLTPLELIKCRLQVSTRAAETPSVVPSASLPPSLTVGTCVRHVYRHEGGLRGFYQGGVATLLREVPGVTVWCGTNSLLRDAMTPAGGSVDDLSLGETVLCGGVSGLAHSLLLYPVDLLKTRIQTEPSHYRRLSFAQVVRMHYHECGLRGFYRGFGLVAVFSFPSSALAFTTYQSVAHALTPRPRRHYADL